MICDNFFASVGGPSLPEPLLLRRRPVGRRDRQPREHRDPRRRRQERSRAGGATRRRRRVRARQGRQGEPHQARHVLHVRDGAAAARRDRRRLGLLLRRARAGRLLLERPTTGSRTSSTPTCGHEHDPPGRPARAGHRGADRLPAVTWVTPRFELSDHPPESTCFAHNWLTDVVNAVMKSDEWEHTAIFLTWDEWGGFYDHVPPPDGRRRRARVPRPDARDQPVREEGRDRRRARASSRPRSGSSRTTGASPTSPRGSSAPTTSSTSSTSRRSPDSRSSGRSARRPTARPSRGPATRTRAGKRAPPRSRTRCSYVAPSGARSNPCARRSTPRSSPRRPTICSPTGRPSGVNPQGTEIAGHPVTVMHQHDSIQSR